MLVNLVCTARSINKKRILIVDQYILEHVSTVNKVYFQKCKDIIMSVCTFVKKKKKRSRDL